MKNETTTDLPTYLTKLEKMAREAVTPERWPYADFKPGDGILFDGGTPDELLIAACSPELILALVEVAAVSQKIEDHCSGKTGTKRIAHAQEGRALRAEMQAALSALHARMKDGE